jgi:hypothetical protein
MLAQQPRKSKRNGGTKQIAKSMNEPVKPKLLVPEADAEHIEMIKRLGKGGSPVTDAKQPIMLGVGNNANIPNVMFEEDQLIQKQLLLDKFASFFDKKIKYSK